MNPGCRHCPDDFRCDPEMHAASLSIRKWLRKRLKASIEPVQIGKRNMLRPLKPIGEVPLIREQR